MSGRIKTDAKNSDAEGECKFILKFLELSKGKTRQYYMPVSKGKDAVLVLWYLHYYVK